jgi:hypothetical protein
MFPDEISGDGMIVINGRIVETVYYWLTVVPKAGPVIAEGSISGSEDVMKKNQERKDRQTNSRGWPYRCASMPRRKKRDSLGQGDASLTRSDNHRHHPC